MVDLQIKILQRQLEDQGLSIKISENVRKHLVESGYDAAFGARPLKRVIQKEVLDQLAIQILEDTYARNAAIQVDYRDGKIQFESIDRNKETNQEKAEDNNFEINETLTESGK